MEPHASEERSYWRVAAYVVLLILVLYCHWTALRGWWLADDPQLLIHAIRVSTLDTLTNPEQYQRLATHTFTPLLPISFKIDHALGGLKPRMFYAHQVVLVLVAALLFLELLRRFVPPVQATAASAVLVSFWPTIYAARTLMIRHYLEALIFALVSLLLFVHWKREGDPWRSPYLWSSATAYLLSMLGKELFAALPLLVIALAWIAERKAYRVAEIIMPYALAAAAYLSWRRAMLGSFGGFAGESSARDVMKLPFSIAKQLAGPSSPIAAIIFFAAMSIFLATLPASKRKPAALIAGALFLIAILPVLTLASNFEWRYVFGVAVVLVGAFGLLSGSSRLESIVSEVVVVMVAVAFVFSARGSERALGEIVRPTLTEGRYIYLDRFPGRTLLATSPSWYLSGIAELRRLEKREAGPRFVNSKEGIAIGGIDADSVVSFRDGEIRHFSPILYENRLLLSRRRRDVKFDVVLAKRNDVLEWRLSASREGSWSLLTLPEFAKFQLPPKGSRRIPEAYEEQYARFMIEFEEGWSVTPPIALPRDGSKTRWRGFAD